MCYKLKVWGVSLGQKCIVIVEINETVISVVDVEKTTGLKGFTVWLGAVRSSDLYKYKCSEK